MIKVYGVHGPPYVRKVFIALDIKDVPYEIVRQMPFSEDAEYLKINPLGKIPSLVDGDLTLCDSKVICQYLDDAYPEPWLYPTRPNDWARANRPGPSILASQQHAQRLLLPPAKSASLGPP